MSSDPAVSVIVLGYNGREYVDSCLESVLDQDFERPYEVLFVDNASRDGSADVAATREGVQVYRLDQNYGYCQGNNLGAEHAKAGLLLFLNQDVVVHRSWLRTLVEALESDASIKAAHVNLVHPWNPEYATKERSLPPKVAYVPDLSRFGFVEYRRIEHPAPVVDTLFLSGVSILLQRDVLAEVGGYVFDPEMFAYGEDVDLALRIRNAGYRTVLASGSVVYHDHTLEGGVSIRSFQKTVRIIRNRLLAFWKNTHWPEFAGLAAVTVLGSPLNSGQFGLSGPRRVLYAVMLIPPTLAAAAATLLAMPRYSARRRQVLASRRTERGWILWTLLFDRSGLGASVETRP